MEDKEARDQLALLTARVLGIRDVVARLLAYEATRATDPTSLLQSFSEATDQRIHWATDGHEATEPALWLVEAMRKEIDWIVAAALKQI
jgi:hypothetical protein